MWISGNQVIKILRYLVAMLLLDSFIRFSHYVVLPRKSMHGFTFFCVECDSWEYTIYLRYIWIHNSIRLTQRCLFIDFSSISARMLPVCPQHAQDGETLMRDAVIEPKNCFGTTRFVVDLNTAEISYLCVAYILESKFERWMNIWKSNHKKFARIVRYVRYVVTWQFLTL